MDTLDRHLQYMVREHLTEEGFPEQKSLGHGLISPQHMLDLRWNSQFGAVFVDGSHMKHDLELGDEIKIDGHAPILKIIDFDSLHSTSH